MARKQIRCPYCNWRLFDVITNPVSIVVEIKCQRCGQIYKIKIFEVTTE